MSATDELGSKVASGVRWGLVDQVVQQSVRLGVTVVLTKLVEPRDIGLMGIAWLVVNLASLLTGVGLTPAIVQRKDLTRAHLAVGLTASAALGTAMTAIVAISAGPLASFFDQPRVRPVLLAMSAIFVLLGIEAVPHAVLRRHLLFREYVASTMAAVVVAGAVGVTLAAAGLGVWALVGYALTEAACACVLAWGLALRSGLWRPEASLDGTALREMLGYSAYVTGAQVLAYGQNNGDNFVVGKVLGATALGYYALAYRLMLYPIQKVADLLYTVALPALASVQGDLGRTRTGFLRAIRYVALVCFPVTIGISLTAPLLVPMVFGEKWRPAVVALQVLAVNGPRIVILRLSGTLYHAIGRPQWGVLVNATSLVLYVPAFVIGVRHGIEGVAVGYTVAGFLTLPIGLHFVGRALELPVSRLLTTLAPVGAATAVMALCALAARTVTPDSAGRSATLVAMVVIGAAAYAASLWRLDPGVLTGVWSDLVRRSRA